MARMSSDERAERTRENRNYLAQHQAMGDISLRKSPYEASATYVNRVADNLKQQEKAGLPLDVGASRGHVDKEHGKARKRDTTKAAPNAYKLARRVNQIPDATLSPRGEIILPHSEHIEHYLKLIADQAPNAPVVIEYGDVTLFSHGGIKAEEVQRLIADEYDGDAQSFFDAQHEKHAKQSPKKKDKPRDREKEREHSQRKRERARARRRA